MKVTRQSFTEWTLDFNGEPVSKPDLLNAIKKTGGHVAEIRDGALVFRYTSLPESM